jgi:imidazolonepropionase-like amidohydrolase
LKGTALTATFLTDRRRFLSWSGICLGSTVAHHRFALGAEPATNAGAEGKPTAWINATLLPVDRPAISSGVMVISGNKIVAVGEKASVSIPGNAQIVDATGKWIMPGLICTHSHIGGFGAADSSSPIQPGVRILDSINVRDAGFRRALAGGLTTLNIMPGSGHLISGQTVYCKLRFFGDSPQTIDDILIRDGDGKPIGGLKMANGTNSQGDAPFPGTRGKSAFLVREQYLKAREYHAKVTAANGNSDKMPPRDLNLESLVEAMQGKRIVHHHTHRHDDIMTVIRLSQEFGFQTVLHHVSDGWKVAKEIAAAKMPCSIIVLDSPGGKLEAKDLVFRNGRVLEEAGVRVAFHTDDWITDSRWFMRSAALAVRAGMSRDKAIAGLTLAGAEMLGLADRLGSLSVGKEADFAILDGDPLSVATRVRETWVDGHKAFDLSQLEDQLYAEGGFKAGGDVDPFLCCYAPAWQGGAQ